MYIYNAYGLTIASEMQLNGLIVTSGIPEVNIEFGDVPLTLDPTVRQKRYQEITAKELLFEVTGVAKFYVTDGKSIVIQKAPQCHDGDIQVFLMGTVFAYVLQYHDYLVLHGSAVLINDKAIIFSGQSGAGKSTIAAAFARKGYSVLTDDMVALKYSPHGQLELIPGWPRLKLWQDALSHLGEKSNELIQVQNKQNKYEFPIDNHNLSYVAVDAFYELNSAENELITLNYVTDVLEKLDLLVKNTFRYYMLEGLNKKNLHFKQCATLSSIINISIVTRPIVGYKLDELVTQIEQHVLSMRK